jgi:hypothetical protein
MEAMHEVTDGPLPETCAGTPALSRPADVHGLIPGWRNLPAVDAAALRADIDAVLSPEL